MSSFTVQLGQTKTVTATYTDSAGANHPLGSLPTIAEVAGLLTFTSVNTTGSAPAVSDKDFQWTFVCPTTLAAGQALEIDITAEGDPTPGVDTIKGKILGSVVAAEDTQVSITVA